MIPVMAQPHQGSRPLVQRHHALRNIQHPQSLVLSHHPAVDSELRWQRLCIPAKHSIILLPRSMPNTAHVHCPYLQSIKLQHLTHLT